MIKKIAVFCQNFMKFYEKHLLNAEYIKESFRLTNSNFILVTPLILFLILIEYYLIISTAKIGNSAFVLTILLAILSVFVSGWFYSVNNAIEQDTKDDINQTGFSVLKFFPEGVGKHFLQVFFMNVIILFFSILLIFLVYKFAYYCIGNLDISRTDFLNASSSPETLKKFLSGLSSEQQIRLYYWNLSYVLAFTSSFYVFLLWLPEIMVDKKNAFISLLTSVKKVFAKFLKTFSLFAFLLFIYVCLLCFISLFNNPVANFIITIVYFYYFLFAAFLIFLFYKREFKKDE